MLTHTHSPGIEPESSNVRDEGDPALTLSSLTYEKEDSQSSHEMISLLHIMCFRGSSEGYFDSLKLSQLVSRILSYSNQVSQRSHGRTIAGKLDMTALAMLEFLV